MTAALSPRTIILTSGQSLSFDFTGSMIKVKSASGAFTLRADSKNKRLADSLSMTAGKKWRAPAGEVFDKLYVTDTSAAANTIVLEVGDGDIEDTTLTGSVDVDAPGSFSSDADATINNGAQLTIAADDTRRELIIEADDANTTTLRIRDTGATTDEGKRLRPGEVVYWRTKAAVQIVNNSGAAGVVSVCHIKDS